MSTQWRDPGLQRALDAAPDADLRPLARTREAIAQQAHDAVTPAWRRWWAPRGAMPWRAAFATLLVGSLVTLLWQGEEIPGAKPDAGAGDPPIARRQSPSAAAPASVSAPSQGPAPVAVPAAPAPAPSATKAKAKGELAPAPAPTAPVPAARDVPAVPPTRQRAEADRERAEDAVPAQRRAPPELAKRAEAPPAPSKALGEVAPAPATAMPATAPQAPAPMAGGAAPAPTAPAPALSAAAPAPAAAAPAPAPAAPAPAAAPPPPGAAFESRARLSDNAASPQGQGIRGLTAEPAVLATGANAAARNWRQVRIEAEGRALVVTREQAGPLPDLIGRALQAGTMGLGTPGANGLRLELSQGGEMLGTLESNSTGWRWLPAGGPAAGYRLRIEGELADSLRAEAGRLLRR